MKFLVADDHPTFRIGVKQVLKDLDPGAEVVEANDFTDALEVTAKNSIAVQLYRQIGFRHVKTVYKAVEVAYT